MVKNTVRIMPTTDAEEHVKEQGLTRRSLLAGGAAGAVIGFGGGLGVTALRARSAVNIADEAAQVKGVGHSLGPLGGSPGFGGEALECHGTHQAGIATVLTAHTRFISYRLHPSTDRSALERMFRILTGDIEGLASGEGPLADPEPELASRPARLSITVGVGPELVNRVDPGLRPQWLAPLPEFSRDQLSGAYDGGDLLIMLQADDPMPIAHAARMFARDLASFAEPLWEQNGFRQARGAEAPDATMRNLMGQIDGTVNPQPEDEDFDGLVWLDESAGWLEHGTAFVLRRIRMELDTWDMVDRPGREMTIGRRLADGAPLTGGDEHAPVDFEAKNEHGLTVIPAYAHIRRAHSTDPDERIVRRTTNYDEGGESGLLFGCVQRNPLTQFVPIQQRLDELDLLNEWVTHVGSAVFAFLPGFTPGEMLGQTLLEA